MAAAMTEKSDTGAPKLVMEKTDKRDYLTAIESTVQESWGSSDIFQTSPVPLPESCASYTDFFGDLSPEEIKKKMQKVQEENPKWFGTFPYPYMNGSLHLGHSFTISKIEFAAGFERMQGKRVLFPMGLHCTGMPIKSAADKISREMEMFGPEFENYAASDEPAAAPKVEDKPAKSLESTDPSKGKKGKLNAKSTGLTYQFQIMDLIGVPREEIKEFADPQYWLKYFPPIAKTDLNSFGARIDWRRTFVTTDANPYYDSFVRWQMNKLHEQNRIKFGERYTIYSPKDGQPCMDHDRASGEAVNPQEYTAVKMEVLNWGEGVSSEVKQAIGGRKVWMVAATLRPETMYGQTNCFVGPNLKYGIFEVSDNELFLVTERAARNMAFQGTFDRPRGEFPKVADIKGSDVVGTKVKPPFGLAPEVYVLPMESVIATKGTGVVTSVPSDSPDDYQTYMDLRKKAEFYKVKPEWLAVDPIPVLKTPKYGDMAAEALCKEFKIQSQKDSVKLAEAKDIAYKEGFNHGVMIVGEFAGEPVSEAKPKARQAMIDAGLAMPYAEPESEVISRSADVCVVALCDQWYLDYGVEDWKAIAKTLLDRMNTYFPETRNSFQGVLDWLNQWACARSYGLGSKLPWDPQFLVESLSDSTIYMSYYTIAHLLQGGDIYGQTTGPLGITPEQMTDEVWDYVLGSGKLPSGAPLATEKAAELKYNFQYFYPMDVRSSGKDLIPNHLTFCVYVHAALFPEHHWPKSMRCNGHLMLNGKKMSKSTGNFLTLSEAIQKFGADATRLSLADAGDDITDANFEEAVANSAILRLHTAAEWAKEMKETESSLRTGELNTHDKGFLTEMDYLLGECKAAYKNMAFKDALKRGLYDLELARNWYRVVTHPDNGGPGMHRDAIFRYITVSTLVIQPFVPHFAQFIWSKILGETTPAQNAQWPEPLAEIDEVARARLCYMQDVVDSIRSVETSITRRKGKAKVANYDPTKAKCARIFVATKFPAWQDTCVEVLKQTWDTKTNTVDDAAARKAFADLGLQKDKRVMPFFSTMKKRVLQEGQSALDRNFAFSELEALTLLQPYIKSSLKYDDVEILSVEDGLARIEKEGEDEKGWSKEKVETAEPGSPNVQFWNVE